MFGRDAFKVWGYLIPRGSVVLYKDLIVGERWFARLLAAGLSEVLNATQTGVKKIYSDIYRGT